MNTMGNTRGENKNAIQPRDEDREREKKEMVSYE